MTRYGTAARASLPHDPPPDYALLATCRLVPAAGDPPASARPAAGGTAPGYLPRWRAGARRRRGGGR